MIYFNLIKDFFIYGVGIFILTYLIYLILSKKKYLGIKTHSWRQVSSKKVLRKIRNFETPGQIINYLKKIDAFVFEEIILDTLSERPDITVKRNKRYTGDKGIDGQFLIKRDNQYFKGIIQAKRYKSYINNKDVELFKANIEAEKADIGLFIHTGKTGGKVYEHINDNLILISGAKLVDFFKENKF